MHKAFYLVLISLTFSFALHARDISCRDVKGGSFDHSCAKGGNPNGLSNRNQKSKDSELRQEATNFCKKSNMDLSGYKLDCGMKNAGFKVRKCKGNRSEKIYFSCIEKSGKTSNKGNGGGGSYPLLDNSKRIKRIK